MGVRSRGAPCPHHRTCPHSQASQAALRTRFGGTKLTQCTCAVSFCRRSCLIQHFAGVGIIGPCRFTPPFSAMHAKQNRCRSTRGPAALFVAPLVGFEVPHLSSLHDGHT